MTFKDRYEVYLQYFNKGLDDYLNGLKADNYCKTITDAVEYAVKNGGKRVRPVLCLSVADILGVDKNVALKFALAVEFIHSYSLVHDDLPAMDNDDYRRGKPSTHIKFGEAVGILCGDALLNLAMEIIFSDGLSEREVKAAKFLFNCSGIYGMIAGQVFDIESEDGENVNEEHLYKISENKTAKLITAPIVIPAILSDKYVIELKELGKNLGILFQITDDIFDATGDIKVIGKTPHKDGNKITAVKVFGIDGAKEKAEVFYQKCKNIISKIPDGEFLSDFIDYIYSRQN